MAAGRAGDAGAGPRDRELLDRLVRELGPRLLGYIRCAWHPGDAEDFLAETFCRAAANVKALRDSRRPDLYVLTIARNLCRDARRRQRPLTVPDETFAGRADAAPGPAGQAADAEQVRALRAAVRELPEHLREIVVLRLSGDLKFEEIATLLQIPLGTALSRMHAALGQLRDALGTSPARRAT